ncbi:decaprenyl-phosphate phosphoribosyltransferase [Methanobacterium paludis]|jgi:4-hydroxybenzoate polyprenyltransferase|uniref:UbiA prenyltransferase n=1 Tax=Methanobacterium paludis (strain DSM 25820 / JCM 18151 / SWAN1) TaxID=868131 RepID=F6D864_METPW|nr:decaprenyl-phosphate phosphoribosyltransferase [Methanobacterium paludis]AEG17209.1 UbiA prenyltransferase [Methanobacterium paludis]
MFKDILISMRPKQWYKNLIIFIGIVFSLNLLNFNLWINVISAFIVFCLLSGSMYIINDYLDIDKDRNHPKKCKRPLASGRLKASHALFFSTIFIITALGLAYLVNISLFIVSLGFFSLILIYSLFLKKISIVDILVISTGFVLRAVAGCVAIGVFVSPWLIIATFLLALFLALGKRRHELILLKDKATSHRNILDGYSTDMLDQMMNITTASLIMSYSIYTFFSKSLYIMLTIPLAFYGIFRYLYLINAKEMGGDPEMLFKDKGMVLSMALWAFLVIGVLYFNKLTVLI